jgi:hypothetical protein
VRKIVPKENLLEFNVADGWEPLCEFLGDRIPAGRKFLHINESNDFISRSRWRNKMQMANVALQFTMYVAAVICSMAYASK